MATKGDRREVVQQYELQPADFCHKYKLPQPIKFNAVESVDSSVYTKLATLANFP